MNTQSVMKPLSPYQETIFRTRYARWNEDERRRETFPETVDRYLDFFRGYLLKHHDFFIPPTEEAEIRSAIIGLDVMPSMRALMTAGVALEKVQVANYNCTAHPIDCIRALPEMMYLLMSGAGSGFSVERRFTEKLPVVPEELHQSPTTIVVADSRKGWCQAYQQLLSLLYAGSVPKWDVSKVRPAGSRLKTFGGYASGPEPLVELFEHTIDVFRKAEGRKLRPIELFSLATFVAQIVVVGGVRRSATIALFDKDDVEMLSAKSGTWWEKNPHFAMANISAVFEEKPSRKEFDGFWAILKGSNAGEPGIFNRAGVWEHLTRNGRAIERDGEKIPFLANPCCEIILRPNQACNLTGVAIRPDDTLPDLLRKVELATILGTWQACVSKFDYLRKVWQDTVEEDRLLGVCLTGFYDHPVLNSVSTESEVWLNTLREHAIECNRKYAVRIGISPSASVTSVKPAGNSAELYGTASGIHPRLAKFFIRRVRQSNTDPMTNFLRDVGVPCEPSVQNPKRDTVFSFPLRSPDTTKLASEVSALEQLRHWLLVKQNYSTHTVSCTVYVREHEWADVADWVYDHFDEITGLSFLPFDGGTYQQAPFEAIDEETYNRLAAEMPAVIPWDVIGAYEQTDTTVVGQEFTCTAGACEMKY